MVISILFGRIYLVSVTKSGCLTVHDFEALYCQTQELTCLKDCESKHLLHLSQNRQLDTVRWNLLNQDEVVCASVKSNELLIFDVGYVSSEPVEGARTASAIESFALEQMEVNVVPPEVTELHGPDVIEEKCGSAAICLAFLLDILDSKAEGRNR
ncbi:uncharacterized protein LOC133295670 isoform X1 [Gastrolobium bilobum]|uniref:uncharacterized protein LOC133295670 isoform X1 n=1 Tax=Gastrolobium bilobum TaxID=150636 RepID=UPI002AB2EF3C|nr:uncharacterized protein LOC133295670 isoform X1 [Gastrolobium bilobum]XP_061350506.1 uncharacterized protein LOC133295670 isoform X1 [Gastrolobium bilobum]XP_061350514.1 uncharacterized protein LOC133295670 isoform X1 [Gastrolobium bilobum]